MQEPRAPALQARRGASSLCLLGRRQYLSCFHVLELLNETGRPSDLDQPGRGIAIEAHGQPLVAGRKVTGGSTDGEVLARAGSGYNQYFTVSTTAGTFRPATSGWPW